MDTLTPTEAAAEAVAARLAALTPCGCFARPNEHDDGHEAVVCLHGHALTPWPNDGGDDDDVCPVCDEPRRGALDCPRCGYDYYSGY